MLITPDVLKHKDQLLSIIRSQPFRESGEIRSQLFEALSVIWDRLAQNYKDEITALIAYRLEWPKERVEPTLRLESKMDLRRAVEWAPRLPERARDERLFPTEGWIGAYLLYAQENEAPLAWHFWSAVTILGAACQRHVYVDRGAYVVWPNYYTVLVGPSGSGKSIAINMAVDILKRVNDILKRDDKWPADRRIRLLPESVTPTMFIEELRTGIVKDTAKGTVLEERWKSSIGFLANDEMTTLLGRANYHSKKLIHIFTALYQCPDQWVDATLMRGEAELRDVAFSLLTGSAVEWIRDEVSEAMLKGGFIARCTFSYKDNVNRILSKPGFNDPIAANMLAQVLVELVKSPFMAMTLTDEAEAFYNDWYMDFKTSPRPFDINVDNTISRKPTHVLKLSMILAISRNIENRVIHKNDIELAVKILDQEEVLYAKMFGEINASPESQREDYVLEAIKNRGMWTSRRDIFRLVYRRITNIKSVDKILLSLKKRGMIESVKGKQKQMFYRAIGNSSSEPPVG